MSKIYLGGGVRRVHFIGIGGISMSGLAEILRRDGYEVTGSDAAVSETTDALTASGFSVWIGHDAARITPDVDLVVHTAAVKPDNPEYAAALAARKPVMDRARLLGLIMAGYERAVCVAGTHGKTSATALAAEVLLAAGLDPTVSIGGYMGEGYNFRVGASPYFVMEACEYFDSFLQWRPWVGAVLNIDNDHMDYFGSMERLEASFESFARNIAPGGALVLYAGTRGYARLACACAEAVERPPDGSRPMPRRIVSFGIEGEAYEAAPDFLATGLRADAMGRFAFTVTLNGARYADVSLRLAGRHQVYNALAAAAAAHALDVAADAVADGLNRARGVRRRFELKGTWRGMDIVDDYAHHPTEIRASLRTAKASGRRVVCVFQPHTYSRTRLLFDEFTECFRDADTVLLLPVYAARESDPGDVSVPELARRLRANGVDACYCDGFDAALRWIGQLRSKALLITMGAGDVFRVGDRLLGGEFSTLSTG